MFSRGKKISGSHWALSVLFSTCMSLLFTHKLIQQILTDKHIPDIVQGPGGLKMERHRLCFYFDYRSY